MDSLVEYYNPETYYHDMSQAMELGSQCISSLVEVSRQISDELDQREQPKDLVGLLNDIFGRINTKELQKIRSIQEAGPAKKLWYGLTNTTNRLMGKYTLVSEELGALYVELKVWEQNLKENSAMLTALIKSAGESQRMVLEEIDRIRILEAQYVNIINPGPVQEECHLIVQQRLGDLTQQHEVARLKVNLATQMQRTNYNIYKKLQSTYLTSLPMIQINLSTFKLAKESEFYIDSLAGIDAVNEDLMKLTVQVTGDTSKKVAKSLSYNLDSVQTIQKLIDELDKTSVEVRQIQDDHLRRIESVTGRSVLDAKHQ